MRELLGQQIKQRRLAVGLSRAEAAERLGVRQPNYRVIENGNASVSLERIVRLASVLQCAPLELVEPVLRTWGTNAEGLPAATDAVAADDGGKTPVHGPERIQGWENGDTQPRPKSSDDPATGGGCSSRSRSRDRGESPAPLTGPPPAVSPTAPGEPQPSPHTTAHRVTATRGDSVRGGGAFSAAAVEEETVLSPPRRRPADSSFAGAGGAHSTLSESRSPEKPRPAGAAQSTTTGRDPRVTCGLMGCPRT